MKKLILAASQSSIARQVAEYAVTKYSEELSEISQDLLKYDDSLPVSDILDNIRELIYTKYFNYYKKKRGPFGDDYGAPPSDLDSCLRDVDKWWDRELSLYGIVCTRHKELIIQIVTQFVDYFTSSYYVIYDCNTGSTELQKSSSGEFRARGNQDLR